MRREQGIALLPRVKTPSEPQTPPPPALPAAPLLIEVSPDLATELVVLLRAASEARFAGQIPTLHVYGHRRGRARTSLLTVPNSVSSAPKNERTLELKGKEGMVVVGVTRDAIVRVDVPANPALTSALVRLRPVS